MSWSGASARCVTVFLQEIRNRRYASCADSLFLQERGPRRPEGRPYDKNVLGHTRQVQVEHRGVPRARIGLRRLRDAPAHADGAHCGRGSHAPRHRGRYPHRYLDARYLGGGAARQHHECVRLFQRFRRIRYGAAFETVPQDTGVLLRRNGQIQLRFAHHASDGRCHAPATGRAARTAHPAPFADDARDGLLLCGADRFRPCTDSGRSHTRARDKRISDSA